MNSLLPRDSARPAPRGMGPAIQPVDLTGTVSQVRASLAVVDAVAGRFARLARRSLPFLARYRTAIAAAPAGLVSADQLSEAAGEPPTFTVQLQAKVGRGWARLILDAGTISVILEGALGGTPLMQSAALPAELSTAQRALVSRVATSLARDLASALAAEGAANVSPVGRDASSRQEINATGDVIHAVCHMEGLSVPAAMIVAVSTELVASGARKVQGQEPVEQDPRMADALLEVPIELIGELGRIKLSLRKVLSLEVGDVIRLDTAVDDLIPIRIAGNVKLEGVPMASRGQMAVEIKRRHEA